MWCGKMIEAVRKELDLQEEGLVKDNDYTTVCISYCNMCPKPVADGSFLEQEKRKRKTKRSLQ
jgi:hypothetical protein